MFSFSLLRKVPLAVRAPQLLRCHPALRPMLGAASLALPFSRTFASKKGKGKGGNAHQGDVESELYEYDEDHVHDRMADCMRHFLEQLGGLRVGRASPTMLNHITVPAYGSKQNLNHVANVTVKGAQQLIVNVFDPSLKATVEKAIREADMGLNPVDDGQVLSVPIPKMTAETRQAMVKTLKVMTEQAKVSVRNVRRDEIEKAKVAEKQGVSGLSKDDLKRIEKDIQQLHDTFVKDVDASSTKKEKEIMN